jgi:hypothetical protein
MIKIYYNIKVILKRGQYLFQNTSMVVYALIRVVRWSVLLWRVATRRVFNNSVSDLQLIMLYYSYCDLIL